jgi:hypothetical protein
VRQERGRLTPHATVEFYERNSDESAGLCIGIFSFKLMGIDIYACWQGQTPDEIAVQYRVGFSIEAGGIGYRRGSVQKAAAAALLFPNAQSVVSSRHTRVEAVVFPRLGANASPWRSRASTFPREPVEVANSVVHAIACLLKPVPPTCRRLKDNRTVPADKKELVKDNG